jgi:catechol 2,3-dioxygenase-like lactoylglutathione lyase family enzyme
MLDHVSIGVRDIARANRFSDPVLVPLGYNA